MGRVAYNVDDEGNAKTILAGYFKFVVATLIGGTFGTSGTCIIELYENDSD